MPTNDTSRRRPSPPDRPAVAVGRDAFDEADPRLGELRSEYRSTLVAPLDDMWASFAEAADAFPLLIAGELAGYCSIGGDGVGHRFYVRAAFEEHGDSLFAHVVAEGLVRSVVVATIDPGFLSLCMPYIEQAVPVALLYRHRLAPEGPTLQGLRPAIAVDLPSAVEFVHESTGDPQDWVEDYLATQVGNGALHLHELDGSIAAVGECRVDERVQGYAHLGLIVGPEHRARGLGTSLMKALVELSHQRDLKPLCSTEPDNQAARHVIGEAGFRSHHRIFRASIRTDAP